MGFINGVKTVFSDLKEYINQIDCPDEEELITDPELVASLQSIKKREEADPKAVNAIAKEAQEAQEKQQPVVEKGGEER